MAAFNLMTYLSEVAPAVLILVVGLRWASKRIEHKDEEIKAMNKSYINQYKDNLVTLTQLSTLIDSMVNSIENQSTEIKEGFKGVKDHLDLQSSRLEDKISALKK